MTKIDPKEDTANTKQGRLAYYKNSLFTAQGIACKLGGPLQQDLFQKKATLICITYKTCAFSYTHRLDAICHRMLSIFDRNVSFLVHIYSKNMLVAKWNDFMSPSLSAEMMEIDLPAFIMKIDSNLNI